MFSQNKIWAAWPYMLSMYVIWCKNEALKKIALQKHLRSDSIQFNSIQFIYFHLKHIHMLQIYKQIVVLYKWHFPHKL